MPDREKVISGLMHHREKCSINGDICPYLIDQDECVRKLCDDVLELLKAQEPVKPTWRQGFAFCGKCGRQFGSGFKYCPDCGKEVKWDAGTST